VERKNGKQGYLAGIIANQLTLANCSIPENLIFACFTALGSDPVSVQSGCEECSET
jgi:hypothetical protein